MSTLDEMETCFTVEATDRNTVHVFTNDTVWQRKIEALGIAPYRVDAYGKSYRVDLNEYNFGFTRKRKLTAEHRQRLRERMTANKTL